MIIEKIAKEKKKKGQMKRIAMQNAKHPEICEDRQKSEIKNSI